MDGLDHVEPMASDEKDELGDVTVRLKEGLDLQELTSKQGTEILLDTNEDFYEDDTASYKPEDVFNHLNYDCTNENEEKSPFELMAHGMEDITSTKDGGVLKKVLREGVGQLVPSGAIVRVHYNGYLEYSEEPYDSSRLRNRQEQFKLGKGVVILGWEVAVSTMRKKELSRYLVTAPYAYGDLGCPPRIPPKATIMFEIELISYVDHDVADSYESFTAEERRKATVEQLVKVANAERELGNDFFHQKIFGKAMRKYERAVSLVENAHLQNEEDEHLWRDCLVKLYLNIAICCLKQAKSTRAITFCRKVLNFEPNNPKAIFRLGQAYMQLAEFGRSREYLVRASQLSRGSEEVRQELVKLDRKVQKYKAMERVTYTRMFNENPAPPAVSTPSPAIPKEESSENNSKIDEIIYSRFRSFCDNELEKEFVLPSNFDPEEIECAIRIAEQMNVPYEKGGRKKDFSVRFYKLDVEL